MNDVTDITSWTLLEKALDYVSVEGWLDRSWSWRIELVQLGWLVTAEFTRPDRGTGAPGHGRGRPFLVPWGATAREVWGTAFASVKLALEHELLEAFHVCGRRVFDPHVSMIAGPGP